MPLDFSSNTDFVDQNNQYMDELYALQPGRFDAYATWATNNLSTLLDAYTLPTGKVTMLGVWNCHFYDILKAKYGAANCTGFDIHEYHADDTVTIGDFRTIHSSHTYDVALVYNAMGTWENNGSSKLKGLEWATTNVVTGGYYLEQYTTAASTRISQTETESGFTYLGLLDNRMLVFQN